MGAPALMGTNQKMIKKKKVNDEWAVAGEGKQNGRMNK